MNVRPIVRAMCRPMVRGLIPFDPLSLFANGEQGAWYDPSDLTTLYQDSAGTTPVTIDGDPVGLMLDKSGNGNDASQATASLKPIYRTDGTLHWLEGDGFDDYIQSNAGSITAQPTTQMCGFQVITDTANVNIYNGVSASSVQYLVNGNVNFEIYAGYIQGLAGKDLDAHVANVVYNGVSSIGRVDGVQEFTGDLGANGWEGNTFFSNRSFVNHSNAKIFAHIVVCRELSAEEIENTETYLATKSGVTL
ncbi:MAG: hypothetical protein ACPH3N_00690 [Alcanivorax sediminis]|uniref:hypothetical protein n=1 Tax=Alcanivorax sediminis TaxID=2663008 RepID=UPI003C545B6B